MVIRKFFQTTLLGAVLLAIGCGKSKPVEPKGDSPKPPKAAAPVNPHESPEALARAFHQHLADNDAIRTMQLSMLGAPTNSWVEFSGKLFRNSLKILEKNLADLEAAKPRDERSDAEQTRIFNLMAQRDQMTKAHTNSMKRLSIELPEMRERFLQRGFLDVVLQFKAAGLDPAELKVSRVDASKLTDQYQGIEMHGGPLTVWFSQNDSPLDTTLTLVVAKVPLHGWVFVQDPILDIPAVPGPEPESEP